MQTRWQRLFEFLFFVILIFPFVSGSLWLAGRLQWMRCPTKTFAAGNEFPNLQEFGTLIAGLGLVFLLEYWALYWFVPLQKILGDRIRRHGKWPWFLRRLQSNASILALVSGFLLTAFAVGSNFCLTPEQILTRSRPWGSGDSHGWFEVVGIATSCTRGYRGRWNKHYLLFMRNGTSLDIMQTNPHLSSVRAQLFHALQGSVFVFNSTEVDPNCYADSQFLRLRP